MTDDLVLWQFVRGDMQVSDFEAYAYSKSSLEEYLGGELYLDLISLDFKDRNQVHMMRSRIKEYLLDKEPLKCECIALRDLERIDTSSQYNNKVFSSLEKVKAYGEPLWWLDCYQCRQCSQYWMVAKEQIDYDTDILKKIDHTVAHDIVHNNIWPNDFKIYLELFDFYQDSEFYRSKEFLSSAIRKLTKIKPNITIKEIAVLLNLTERDAFIASRNALERKNVKIDFGFYGNITKHIYRLWYLIMHFLNKIYKKIAKFMT